MHFERFAKGQIYFIKEYLKDFKEFLQKLQELFWKDEELFQKVLEEYFLRLGGTNVVVTIFPNFPGPNYDNW